MKTKNNYETLSNKLFEILNQLDEDKIDIQKALSIVRTASTINSIQKAKLISTRLLSEEKRVKFYED
jgi:hypothetical protein